MKTKQDHDAGRQGQFERRRHGWPARVNAIVFFLTAVSIVSCNGKHEMRKTHECNKPKGEVSICIIDNNGWATMSIKFGIRPINIGLDANEYYMKQEIVRLGEDGEGGWDAMILSVPCGVYKIDTLEVYEVGGDRKPIEFEVMNGDISGLELIADGNGPVYIGIVVTSERSN